MAGIWVSTPSADWPRQSLDGEPLLLQPGEPPQGDTGSVDLSAGGALIVRSSFAGTVVWLLLAGSAAVRVNGSRLDLGIRVLADRDEILLGDVDRSDAGRFYFSTENLACIEPFPGGQRAGVCPRCRRPIATGTSAVRCPQCDSWHHEAGEMNCWTCDDKCGRCPQTTALDAGYRFTPEGL
jgi:hypothetical protein